MLPLHSFLLNGVMLYSVAYKWLAVVVSLQCRKVYASQLSENLMTILTTYWAHQSPLLRRRKPSRVQAVPVVL
jgi:hypothetical protein